MNRSSKMQRKSARSEWPDWYKNMRSAESGQALTPENNPALNLHAPTIQPKLEIGQPNDSYEQEADTMADQVMTNLNSGNGDAGLVQKTELEDEKVQMKCEACEEEQIQTQSFSARGPEEAPEGLEQDIAGSKGKGKSMGNATRNSMEEAFGSDFSNVNIHTGAEAADMSSRIQAKAFTHGSDIYFNRGQYAPETNNGQRLLAHELTHVVQQGGAGPVSAGSGVLQRTIIVGGQRMRPNDFSGTLATEVQTWYNGIESFLQTQLGTNYNQGTHMAFTPAAAQALAMEILNEMDDARKLEWPQQEFGALTDPNYKKKKKKKKPAKPKNVPYEFTYQTQNQVIQDVLFRLSMIQNMHFANETTTAFGRFPGSGEGYNMQNTDNWIVAEQKDNKVSPSGFILNSGNATPSAGINQLIGQGATGNTADRIVVDCSTMLGLVTYWSMMQRMGEQGFNEEVGMKSMTIGPLDAVFDVGGGFIPHTLNSYYKVVSINSLEELVPGDRIAFANVKAYKDYVPGGLWTGEFGIYIGKEGGEYMFSGFGAANKSYDTMIQDLWDNYLKDRGLPANPNIDWELNSKMLYNPAAGMQAAPGLLREIRRFDVTKIV